jgi:thioredoxin-like negative regulator of GroEL
MPTFLIFKDGKKVDEFVGANPPALLNLLKKYNPEEAEADAAEKEGSEKAESPKNE